MAKKGGKKDEHQMLFDLRGKRRHVVKVVYAVLAILMGLSLLLIAGPLPFGDIFGSEDAQEVARDQAEERIERVEVKLRKDPADPDLLASLTRAHLSAGSTLSQQNPTTGQIEITPEGRQQYEQASSVWDEYLEATGEPSIGLAQQMASTLLTLAQFSRGSEEAEANIEGWAEAQEIVAKTRPSLGSLSTLALYLPFTFDYAAAKKAAAEAKQFATSKFQREQLDRQLEESEKNAREFEKQLQEEKKLNKSLQETQEKGEGGGDSGNGGGGFTNPFSIGGSGASE